MVHSTPCLFGYLGGLWRSVVLVCVCFLRFGRSFVCFGVVGKDMAGSVLCFDCLQWFWQG